MGIRIVPPAGQTASATALPRAPRAVPVYLARADWLRLLRTAGELADIHPLYRRLVDAIEAAVTDGIDQAPTDDESQIEG